MPRRFHIAATAAVLIMQLIDDIHDRIELQRRIEELVRNEIDAAARRAVADRDQG